MMPSKYKVHIVGNGAIGSLFAANAIRSSAAYALYPRQKAISTMTVDWVDGSIVDITQIHYSPSPLSINDVLLLPLKVHQIDQALEAWLPYLSPSTPVVLMHNGMGGYEAAMKHLCESHPLYLATTSHGAFKQSATRVVYTGEGNTTVGLAPHLVDTACAPEPELLNAFANTLLAPVNQVNNIELALWQKLAVNVVINPLTAIDNIPNGKLLESKYTVIIDALCDETANVANAVGVPLTKDKLVANVKQIAELTATNFSSMHQDVKHKRITEINAINGYITSLAKRHNIETPQNALLVKQIIALSPQ